MKLKVFKKEEFCTNLRTKNLKKRIELGKLDFFLKKVLKGSSLKKIPKLNRKKV